MQTNVKTEIEKKISKNGLPFDLETERSVISCMLMDGSCVEHAIELDVDDACFYDSRNREIFKIIIDVKYGDGLNADLVMLKNKLKGNGKFKGYNQRELTLFLTELEDTAIFVSNFWQYIKILEEYKQRRQLIEESIIAINKAYDVTATFAIAKDKFSRNHVSITKWLNDEPPEQQWIFRDVLQHGVIGALLASGGIGKTYISLYIMIAAATGQSAFNYFYAERPLKVLGLLAEDPANKTWERFKRVVSSFESLPIDLLNSNLCLVCEESEPLMELDEKGNAVVTNAHKCLTSQIKNYKPDLIILDPKSMWYGLEENSNTHNSLWINALRTMANGATLLFSHHVTKIRSGELELNSSRGGSALVDGCRWVANIKKMDSTTGDKYGIDDYYKFIEFKITKNSYGPLANEEIYFKFTDEGVLERAMLKQERLDNICQSIKDILTNNPGKLLSRNEIIKLNSGKFIRDYIKQNHGNVSRSDFKTAINYGFQNGVLSQINVQSGGKPKLVISP